jgi:glycosyltransferase involved in cell wall biosynthesis
MLKPNEKVAIGWIDPGTVHTKFAGSVARLILNSHGRISEVLASSGSYLSLNRNTMVERFLAQEEADWLLMFDSDVIISPEDFERLINSADKDTHPIMSGKYFLTFSNGELILAAQYRNNDDVLSWLVDYEENTVYDNLTSVGCGYVLIHRSVFEAVSHARPGHKYPWFQDEWNGETWMSEDVYFFDQCTALGIPVSLNTGASSNHLKQFGISDSSYAQSKKMEKIRDGIKAHNHEHDAMHRTTWWRTWRGKK